MKRYGLWLTTLGAILLTGVVLRGAGWSTRPQRLSRERGAHPWASAGSHCHPGQVPHFSSLHYLLRAGH